MTFASDIADPVERLHEIHKASDANKAMMGRVKAALPTDFPLFGTPWLMSGIASIVSRSQLLNLLPPIANVVISNVPGSPVPMYFAGARVVSYYPVSIVAHSMALNVTVQSYDGRLDYGLIACRRAMPDLTDLGDYLLAEHEALLARAKAHVEAQQVEAAAEPEGKKADMTSANAKVAAAKSAKRTAVRASAKSPAALTKAVTERKLKLVHTDAKPAAVKRSQTKRQATA